MHQAPTHLLVRQAVQATFRALVAERPAVVRVRQGEKRVGRGGAWLAVGPGRLAVLPAGEPLTIENKPTPGGPFLASALVLGPESLPLGDPDRVATDDRALAAFDRAAAACEDPLLPPALREHAVAEVILWLAQEGVGLGPARAADLASRLRALLAEDLAMPWMAPEAARSLAVSEATLRRRLAREGTSFSDLLADLRMTRALGLLQATGHPVNRVALEVGYECPSRFAARFRARFGISPSAVRGQVDRIGTDLDRHRAAAHRPAG